MSTGGSLRLDHSNSDNSTKNPGTSKPKRSEKDSSHVDCHVPHYLRSLPNPEVEEYDTKDVPEEYLHWIPKYKNTTNWPNVRWKLEEF